MTTRHTHTFALGLGLTATVTYRGLPPLDPPESGSEWSAELDWPRVEATLYLPSTPYGRGIEPPLRAAGVSVMGDSLDALWGQTEGTANHRMRVRGFSAPLVATAYADAAAFIDAAIATLREVVSARAARLAEREQTIARALESAPPGLFEHPRMWDRLQA
jgi:hypothetical protein